MININDAPPEDPQIDTLKVAEYVGEHLLFSSLAPFFTRTQRPPGKKLFEDGESVFEYFCKNETYAKGGSCTWGDLMEHLVGLCHGVFEKPATAMRRSLRVARPVNIYGNGGVDHVQIRMDDTVCYYILIEMFGQNTDNYVGCRIRAQWHISHYTRRKMRRMLVRIILLLIYNILELG